MPLNSWATVPSAVVSSARAGRGTLLTRVVGASLVPVITTLTSLALVAPALSVTVTVNTASTVSPAARKLRSLSSSA